jgi:hypothetical protein
MVALRSTHPAGRHELQSMRYRACGSNPVTMGGTAGALIRAASGVKIARASKVFPRRF